MAVRSSFVKQAFVLAVMAVAPGCGDAVTAPSTQMDEALGLSVTSATLLTGESLRIEATAAVAVVWESSRPDVVSVSPDGVVAALKAGEAEVIARASGKKGKAKVKVTQPEQATTPTPDPTSDPIPPPTPGPSQGTPVFQDAFDGGTFAAAAGGYRWVGAGAAMSRDVAHSGAFSMKFSYAGSADLCEDAWSEQRFQFGENLPEVWLEYYIYLPRGTEGTAKFTHRKPTCAREEDPSGNLSNNKFLALWDTAYSIDRGGSVRALLEYRRSSRGADGDSYMYGMWGTDTRTAGDYGLAGGNWDPAFTDALRGRWVQVRVRARVADSKQAANGALQLWVDGALKIDMQNLDLAPGVGGARWFRNGYLMGWANSGFDQNTAVYIDDFKIFRSSPGW